MIDGLIPYPKYRDSGLPWLPRIPASWSVVRNGRLFTQRNRTGHSNLPILEVSLRSGVRVRDMKDGGRKQVMADRSKYKQARAGDLAYNTMRMWQGAVGVAPVDGLVSPAYVVATPVPDADATYLARLFRTSEYLREIDTFSRGIVKDRNRLYWEAFKQIPTPCPPRDEQGGVVRFLANADRLVQRCVQSKQSLVALITEQRRTAIHRAVVGGLDSARSHKPSDSRFIGNVPSHWAVLRLRNVADMLVSNVDKRSTKGEQPVRLCNYVDVYRNEVVRADMPFMIATATASEVRRFALRVGDVLITKDSEEWLDIGVPAIVGSTASDLVCGYHLAILRPRAIVRPHFLLRCLQSRALADQLSVGATGVTRYGLSQAAIKDVLVPVPPLSEQDRIVAALQASTESLDQAIGRSRSEIALLRAHATRLAADVVMGRVDVRSAAAQLEDCADHVDVPGEPHALSEEEPDEEPILGEAEEARA